MKTCRKKTKTTYSN